MQVRIPALTDLLLAIATLSFSSELNKSFVVWYKFCGQWHVFAFAVMSTEERKFLD